MRFTLTIIITTLIKFIWAITIMLLHAINSKLCKDMIIIIVVVVVFNSNIITSNIIINNFSVLYVIATVIIHRILNLRFVILITRCVTM